MPALTLVAAATASTVSASEIGEVGPPPLRTESVDPTEQVGVLTPGIAAQASDRACINTSRIHNWDVLDRSNLVIYAPTRDTPYHVSLLGFCQDLDRGRNPLLGFVSQSSRLCSGSGGDIVVGNSRCRIRSITAIDRQTAATLVAQYDVRRQLKGKSSR